MSEQITRRAPTPGPWTATFGSCGQMTGLQAPSGIVAMLGLWDRLNPADVTLIEAAPLFHTALIGDGEDGARLNWLSALLVELRANPILTQAINDTEDPDALWHAVRECEGILASARTAIAHAQRGETL